MLCHVSWKCVGFSVVVVQEKKTKFFHGLLLTCTLCEGKSGTAKPTALVVHFLEDYFNEIRRRPLSTM